MVEPPDVDATEPSTRPVGSSLISVSGGGDLAIATDEMLTKAQSLHAIHEQAVPLSTELSSIAATLEPGLYSASSLAAISLVDAADSLSRAHSTLAQAAAYAGEIADAMDAAALAYGENERSVLAQFANAQGTLAALGIQLMTFANPLPTLLLPLGLWFFGGSIRDSLGAPIRPKGTELPADINRWISDPANVTRLRYSVMSADDILSGLFHLPNLGTGDDVASGAGILLVLASYAGLFLDAPVRVEKTATMKQPVPARSFRDYAEGIPSAVDGEEAQVRIDVITETGKPDRFQVFIGGTADFSPLAREEPFDLTSNIEMVAGQSAGALEGVKQAMAAAGITAESEVVFTGHSQGGLIAQSLVESGEYNTAGLVAFGSPGGGVIIPAGTPAILFENADDLVPALGGMQQNVDAVIVQGRAFASPSEIPATIAVPAHRIETYAELAGIADEDAGSSKIVGVRDSIADFAAGATSVTSNYYQVTRDV